MDITSIDRFRETIKTHRDAWNARGLDDVWDRIVSVVTQPGVDFGHTSIYPFLPEKSAALSNAILKEDRLIFEAHSTDYQSSSALAELTRQHFFFLKVGPELTFRFREAVWALASIEERWAVGQTSGIREIIREQMDANPGYWENYYAGPEDVVRLLRSYSYSDRIRYYWANPAVAESLERLLENLSENPAPETVISQAFPGLEFGEISTDPYVLIEQNVQRCVERYFRAAGHIRTEVI